MTDERLLALEEQRRLFPDCETLPEICVNLRMGTNGSADEWSATFVALTIAMLEARLATWEESVPASAKPFDDAVKAMVKATINETRGGGWHDK